MGLFALRDDHACLTGDCGCETQEGCFRSLGKYINELCDSGDRLTAQNAELVAEIKELKGIQNALAYLYTGYSGETMDDAVKEAKQYIVDNPDF